MGLPNLYYLHGRMHVKLAMEFMHTKTVKDPFGVLAAENLLLQYLEMLIWKAQ